MSANLKLTRRDVLGGLVIAIALPGCKQSRTASAETSFLEPNAWLRIGSDDSIYFPYRMQEIVSCFFMFVE